MSEQAEKITYDAFQISEQENGKFKWNPVGIAFTNRDASINLFLKAFPIDGKVQLRDRRLHKTNQKQTGDEK